MLSSTRFLSKLFGREFRSVKVEVQQTEIWPSFARGRSADLSPRIHSCRPKSVFGVVENGWRPMDLTQQTWASWHTFDALLSGKQDSAYLYCALRVRRKSNWKNLVGCKRRGRPSILPRRTIPVTRTQLLRAFNTRITGVFCQKLINASEQYLNEQIRLVPECSRLGRIGHFVNPPHINASTLME